MYHTNATIIPVNRNLSCLISGFVILVLLTPALGSRVAHADMPPPPAGTRMVFASTGVSPVQFFCILLMLMNAYRRLQK